VKQCMYSLTEYNVPSCTNMPEIEEVKVYKCNEDDNCGDLY